MGKSKYIKQKLRKMAKNRDINELRQTKDAHYV